MFLFLFCRGLLLWQLSSLLFSSSNQTKQKEKKEKKMAGEGKKSFHEWFDGMEMYKSKKESEPRQRKLNCPQVFVVVVVVVVLLLLFLFVVLLFLFWWFYRRVFCSCSCHHLVMCYNFLL